MRKFIQRLIIFDDIENSEEIDEATKAKILKWSKEIEALGSVYQSEVHEKNPLEIMIGNHDWRS